jgi:hypothetical protein
VMIHAQGYGFVAAAGVTKIQFGRAFLGGTGNFPVDAAHNDCPCKPYRRLLG